MLSKRITVAIVALTMMIASYAGATNVILMVGDGAGFNAFNAANMYQGYDAMGGLNFDVAMGMQTHSASNPSGAYDASSMWSNMNWAKSGATDSAAAASAMNTGEKVYDGSINWSTSGQALTSVFENASGYGMATGAVSSVQISHATPAAVAAHNSSRSNYSPIANEMIYNSNLNVIMGAGHPLYDNNGNQVRTTPTEAQAQYVGGVSTWNDMKDGSANGFSYIESASQFQSLASGTSETKVIGIAQAATTLQQARSAGSPLNTNVPTLATMSVGALNVLNNDNDGFAVMIEGGAVDWAAHASQKDRLVEEQTAFLDAVSDVCDWVETNSSWDETLLIVTADHETGYLTGATGSVADLIDNGAGNLPTMEFNSGSHTNSLVPLFAKGVNSDLFADYIIGTDNLGSANYFGINSRDYIDNTSIFSVMNSTVPEPATIVMLGFGCIALFRRRYH